MLNLDEVLDEDVDLVPRFCGDAGSCPPAVSSARAPAGRLPRPPQKTPAAERAEELSAPGALARLEAGRLADEGKKLREQAAVLDAAAERVLAADAAVQDRVRRRGRPRCSP